MNIISKLLQFVKMLQALEVYNLVKIAWQEQMLEPIIYHFNGVLNRDTIKIIIIL